MLIKWLPIFIIFMVFIILLLKIILRKKDENITDSFKRKSDKDIRVYTNEVKINTFKNLNKKNDDNKTSTVKVNKELEELKKRFQHREKSSKENIDRIEKFNNLKNIKVILLILIILSIFVNRFLFNIEIIFGRDLYRILSSYILICCIYGFVSNRKKEAASLFIFNYFLVNVIVSFKNILDINLMGYSVDAPIIISSIIFGLVNIIRWELISNIFNGNIFVKFSAKLVVLSVVLNILMSLRILPHVSILKFSSILFIIQISIFIVGCAFEIKKVLTSRE